MNPVLPPAIVLVLGEGYDPFIPLAIVLLLGKDYELLYPSSYTSATCGRL